MVTGGNKRMLENRALFWGLIFSQTALNNLEMWQEDTFDPETIGRKWDMRRELERIPYGCICTVWPKKQIRKILKKE